MDFSSPDLVNICVYRMNACKCVQQLAYISPSIVVSFYRKKPVLSSHSKIDKIKILKTDGS